MNKVFTKNGWIDYLFWQTEDKKTLKKINQLIRDIERNGNAGIGKPEPLIEQLKLMLAQGIFPDDIAAELKKKLSWR